MGCAWQVESTGPDGEGQRVIQGDVCSLGPSSWLVVVPEMGATGRKVGRGGR